MLVFDKEKRLYLHTCMRKGLLLLLIRQLSTGTDLTSFKRFAGRLSIADNADDNNSDY